MLGSERILEAVFGVYRSAPPNLVSEEREYLARIAKGSHVDPHTAALIERAWGDAEKHPQFLIRVDTTAVLATTLLRRAQDAIDGMDQLAVARAKSDDASQRGNRWARACRLAQHSKCAYCEEFLREQA